MGGGKGGGKGGSSGTGQLNRILQGQLEIQQQQFAREQPFYDLALQRNRFSTGFLPDVEQAVRNPTANPYYQLALNEGLTTLKNNYSVTGSPSSGPAQLAAGRFAAGLEADQVNQMINRLLGVAGIGAPSPSAPQSQALTLSPTIANTAAQIAQIKQANANEPSFGGQILGLGLGGWAGAGFPGLGGIFSSESLKEDIKPVEKKAHEKMLDELLRIPVFTWKYKNGVADGDYHVGTTVEKAPASIRGKDGITLDPVNYFGMLTMGFQELTKKVKRLEADA